MSGPSTHYSVLLKEVDKLWEWGLQAEVERYRKLDREIRYAHDQLKLLCGNLNALQARRLLCEGRLVASHL